MSLKIKQFYKKDFVKFFTLLFVTSIQIVYYIFNHGNLKLANDWQSIELTFNYSEYGFIRRGLMGEIAQKLAELFGCELSYSFLSYFELVFLLVFTLSVFAFFWFFIKSSKPEDRNSVFIITLIFVTLGGVSFYYFDWAEPDIYMICLTLISTICIIKDRLLFLVPVNCALCTMIHEGYPMMFFSVIMVLLFYKWLNKNKIVLDKYFLTLISSGLITSVLFVYFYFISGVEKDITLNYMNQRAIELTGVDQLLNLEYIFFNGKAPENGFWIDGKPTWTFWKNIINILINILLYSPLLYFLYDIQKSTLLKCDNIKERIKYLVCFFGFILVLPLFICHTDTCRWFMDFWFYEFLIFAFMIITGDTKFVDSIHNNNRVKMILFLIPIYFIIGFSMNKWFVNEMSNKISSNIFNDITLLLRTVFS